MYNKLQLIWNIPRAENYSAVVKLKKGAAVHIKAPGKDARAHLVLLYEAHKQAGIAEEEETDEKKED